MKRSEWMIAMCVILITLFGVEAYSQVPVVFKEINIDWEKCLQIGDHKSIHSLEQLKKVPMKYNATCEKVEFPKIDFNNKTLITCGQMVRNGEKAIKSTKIEIYRFDGERKIDIYFATFANAEATKRGKVFEHRKWLLVPKFPENYQVTVRYSLNTIGN
ncbi:MAG: hypothetical protein JEZ14_11005 [Marinilabiliaceae bacterium]|nr:hypothetical protein [Marinilabiliaceae bacterium]